MSTEKMNLQWNHTKAALLDLSEKIKCSICNKLPKDPHLLWCKHSFCKDCILNLPQCPECNYPVKSQDLSHNIMLDQLLSAMKSSSEMLYGNPNSEDVVPTKQGVDKNSQVVTNQRTNTLRHKPKKNNNNTSIQESDSAIALKTETPKEKGNLSLISDNSNCEKKDEKIDNKSKLQKRVLEISKITINKEQNLVEKKITSKVRDRKNDLTIEKDSIDGPGKTVNTSDDVSVTCKMDRDKTPKPKSKPSPKNVTPKSTILFSAKKIQPSNKINVKGETPLQIACRLGKFEMVKKILEEGAEPNVKDYANWTPLCDAVSSGKLEIVKALLEAGAGVNTPSNLNTTALVEAVARRDKAIVKLLMAHGADMHQRTTLNNTALSIADDEMNNILLSLGNVPVQPYPRVKYPARVVLAVKLAPKHMDQLMTLCQKFNLTLLTTFTEDVSHVVVEKTEGNLCHGSVGVMMGILNGCTVVGTDWVTSCLEKNNLLSPDSFEPSGTDDYPNTNVFHKARLNKEQLLPRLFDGCHISLQQDQSWPENHKQDVISLIQASGAIYQPRQCDAERILPSEQTVMFHTSTIPSLSLVSHIILYQPGSSEPLLKYNMAHVKTLSVLWFVQCIKMFSLNV